METKRTQSSYHAQTKPEQLNNYLLMASDGVNNLGYIIGSTEKYDPARKLADIIAPVHNCNPRHIRETIIKRIGHQFIPGLFNRKRKHPPEVYDDVTFVIVKRKN
mgnify:CR=1 FL=1